MIYASKGTSILWDKKHLAKSKEALGLNILSISQTYKIRCDYDKNSDKKHSGIVKKSINGITNDIHNLAIIIDMMQNIINKKNNENSIYSKSNLYLGVLLESYYTNLRSIFDFLPNIIRIGLDESQIKQLPQKDSYNNLLKYVKNDNNKNKLPQILVQNIKQGEEIFNIIKRTRDDIIHKGDETIIFIKDEKICFAILKLTNKGQINLVENILDTEELIYPVFEYLNKLTNMVIEFLELLANTIYYIWCEKEDEEIAIYLSALEGSCIANFIKFLGWISDEE